VPVRENIVTVIQVLGTISKLRNEVARGRARDPETDGGSVLVRDSYLRGEGASEAMIAGLIPVGTLEVPRSRVGITRPISRGGGMVADGAIAERKPDLGADR